MHMKILPTLALASLLLSLGNARADDAPKPPQRCKYGLTATLPVRYVGMSLKPAVEGSINGTPATMLVDTGADNAYLTMTGALRRNLTLQMSPMLVAGAGGVSRVYTTRLEELSIGPGKVRRPEMNVIYTTGFTPHFDGILGASFLLDTDLEIDLRAKRLRLFQPHDCDRALLNIWKQDNTVSVPFEFTRDASNNPHFTVLVNGKQVDAAIDSGASTSFLTLAAARRVGIDVEGKDAKRMPDSSGVGSHSARRWNTPVASLQIGDEGIGNTSIDVLDVRERINVDLYLGQDFLRAHHVLFAMGQKKVYFAYLGGEVFGSAAEYTEWVRSEAESGNPDAQAAIGILSPDASRSGEWLDKAAAANQPNALLEQGRRLLVAGQHAQALPKLRTALDLLPADRHAPLWLYIARMRGGQDALARSELEASEKKQKNDGWPAPVADLFLGKSTPAHLIEAAGDDAARRCDAQAYLVEWHAQRGDKAQADAVRADAAAHCKRTGFTL
jgi:predicted aspartyl protease